MLTKPRHLQAIDGEIDFFFLPTLSYCVLRLLVDVRHILFMGMVSS
jgi:hypothetical protein